MNLFPSLSLKVAPQAKDFRSIVAPTQRGRPYRDSWDVEKAVREGMQRMTWVFRAVHVRATKSAGLPILVRRGSPHSEDVDEAHALLPLLNAYPSPEESAYVFRYRLSAVVDLSRMGAFAEVERNELDDPIGLRLLPPGYTSPIPGTRDNFLDGFRVHIPGLEPYTLKPEQVVWVKHPHPTNPYVGMTPLEAAGITIDTEWMAKLYQRNFLANDGRMGGILLLAGEVSYDDIEELQARIDARSGPSSAGRTTVMEATLEDVAGQGTGQVEGVKFIDTSVSPREAAYMEMRKFNKEEIFAAFGVSDSIGTGSSVDRTFSNADADYLQFWRDTMVDHCTLLDRPFDLVDSDPATFVAHDFSEVAVLARDRMEREKHLLEQLKAGAITWNEYRAEVGRDPYAEGGDSVLEPLSLVPVAGTGGGSRTKARVLARTKEAPGGASLPAVVAWGPFVVDAKALAARRREREKRIRSWERQAVGVLRSLFERQQRATLAKLRGAKTRQGTRHWIVPSPELAGPNPKLTVAVGNGTKIIGAQDVFDLERWDEEIAKDFGALLREVAVSFGEDAFDALSEAKGLRGWETKQGETFDPDAPRLLRFILARTNLIKGANQTTFEAIAATLAEGDSLGETIDDLATRILAVFSEARGYRAERIARTEIISAANLGSREAAIQSEVVETHTWLATPDQRTREAHADADGQTVGLDEPYVVDGAELLFPGDPDGPPELTINCRCTEIYGVEGGPVL